MENKNKDNYGNSARDYQDEPSTSDFEESELHKDPNQNLQPNEEFIDSDPNRFYNDDNDFTNQNSKEFTRELSNDDLEWDGDEDDFEDIALDKTEDDFEEVEENDLEEEEEEEYNGTEESR